MNIFIIVVMLFLFGAFCYLFQKNYNLKTNHQVEIDNLNVIISELLIMQSKYSSAIQLSDDLLFRLKNARIEIDKKLINLQSDLISKLIDSKFNDSL